jgi:hypothetical protein
METFWFGVKLAFGLAIGFGIVLILGREILGFFFVQRFIRAGCTYQKAEKPGTPSGWLTRDPRDTCLGGGDWLLWDERHGVCLRLVDYDCIPRDSQQRFRNWAAHKGITLPPAEVHDSAIGERIQDLTDTWHVSNESLDQFLALAREYDDFWTAKRQPKSAPKSVN